MLLDLKTADETLIYNSFNNAVLFVKYDMKYDICVSQSATFLNITKMLPK